MEQASLADTQNNLVIPKLTLLQFISSGVVGLSSPYFNLFLDKVGMSAVLIGTLLSIGSLLELLLAPVLNNAADRRRKHRYLYRAYILMYAAGVLIYANTDYMAWLIVAVLFLQMSLRPSLTLSFQLTMTKVEQLGRDILGRIRSFAALGFSIAGLVATPLYNLGGYRLIFWGGVVLAAMTLHLSSIFPENTVNTSITSKPAKRRRGFYVLAMSQFFVMMGIRAGYAFWLIHFTTHLGLPTAQVGIFMGFLAGVEVPFFALLDPIIKRYNARIIYIFGALGMGAFFLTLGFVPNLFWLVVLILIRGAIWPMYHLPIFVVTSQISHPNNVATNQALINVTMPSIAVLITGSIAGWIFDTQAAWIFFAACAIACFIGAAIAIFGYGLLAPIEVPAEA